MFYTTRFIFEHFGEGMKFHEKPRVVSEKSKASVEKPKEVVDIEAGRALDRLMKILGTSHYRSPEEVRETVAVKDRYTEQVSQYDVRVISPDKVRIGLLLPVKSKKSFFGDMQVVESETVTMKDLLSGKVSERFKPLSDQLLRIEATNKLRESNRLIEDEDTLKYQVNRSYEDAMDKMINSKETEFLNSNKTLGDFRRNFNELFQKSFKANAVFADYLYDMKVNVKGISVTYKRGNIPKPRVAPSVMFTDEHYSNIDGMYEVKRAEVARKLEQKKQQEQKKT